MTGPSARPVRLVTSASVVALLFALLLTTVAGPVRASTDAAGVPDGAAPVDSGGHCARAVHVDAAVRPPGPAAGTRPAALHACSGRTHVRGALVAIAAALAELLAALAAWGRAGAPGGDRRRRLGAAPLGARAPPAALAA